MSTLTNNKAIKFPTHHYVGMLARTSDTYPLGFMTEEGTDKASMKRKTTVDDWVNRAYQQAKKTTIPAMVYENKPLIGFRLAQNIRHGGGGWGQGNVKWRIEDPRGFELEITSPNLTQILSSCVIENGEILQECMWARLQGDNVLVPVTSEVFKSAQTNSERIKKSVKPSSVKVGNRIVLQNGIEGIYCGKMYEITTDYYSDRSEHYYGSVALNSKKFSEKPKHVIVTNENTIISVSGFKPAEILDHNEMDVKSVENKLYDIAMDRGYGDIYVGDPAEISCLKRTSQQSPETTKRHFQCVTKLKTGEWTTFKLNPYFHQNPLREVDFTEIIIARLSEGKLVGVQETALNPYGRSVFARPKTIKIPFNQIKWDELTVEELHYEVTTAAGNTLKIPT